VPKSQKHDGYCSNMILAGFVETPLTDWTLARAWKNPDHVCDYGIGALKSRTGVWLATV